MLPAKQAMQAIINNQAVGEGVIDAIGKGDTTVTSPDVIHAIHDGFVFLATDPILSQNLYMFTTSQMIVSWYLKVNSSLGFFSHDKLLEYFRDMCTIIEKILIAVDKGSDENHKAALLHGRPVQNQPSTYQNDMVKDQHWAGPPQP